MRISIKASEVRKNQRQLKKNVRSKGSTSSVTTFAVSKKPPKKVGSPTTGPGNKTRDSNVSKPNVTTKIVKLQTLKVKSKAKLSVKPKPLPLKPKVKPLLKKVISLIKAKEKARKLTANTSKAKIDKVKPLKKEQKLVLKKGKESVGPSDVKSKESPTHKSGLKSTPKNVIEVPLGPDPSVPKISKMGEKGKSTELTKTKGKLKSIGVSNVNEKSAIESKVKSVSGSAPKVMAPSQENPKSKGVPALKPKLKTATRKKAKFDENSSLKIKGASKSRGTKEVKGGQVNKAKKGAKVREESVGVKRTVGESKRTGKIVEVSDCEASNKRRTSVASGLVVSGTCMLDDGQSNRALNTDRPFTSLCENSSSSQSPDKSEVDCVSMLPPPKGTGHIAPKSTSSKVSNHKHDLDVKDTGSPTKRGRKKKPSVFDINNTDVDKKETPGKKRIISHASTPISNFKLNDDFTGLESASESDSDSDTKRKKKVTILNKSSKKKAIKRKNDTEEPKSVPQTKKAKVSSPTPSKSKAAISQGTSAKSIKPSTAISVTLPKSKTNKCKQEKVEKVVSKDEVLERRIRELDDLLDEPVTGERNIPSKSKVPKSQTKSVAKNSVSRQVKNLGNFLVPRKHREASLTALAKVRCLYENESIPKVAELIPLTSTNKINVSKKVKKNECRALVPKPSQKVVPVKPIVRRNKRIASLNAKAIMAASVSMNAPRKRAKSHTIDNIIESVVKESVLSETITEISREAKCDTTLVHESDKILVVKRTGKRTISTGVKTKKVKQTKDSFSEEKNGALEIVQTRQAICVRSDGSDMETVSKEDVTMMYTSSTTTFSRARITAHSQSQCQTVLRETSHTVSSKVKQVGYEKSHKEADGSEILERSFYQPAGPLIHSPSEAGHVHKPVPQHAQSQAANRALNYKTPQLALPSQPHGTPSPLWPSSNPQYSPYYHSHQLQQSSVAYNYPTPPPSQYNYPYPTPNPPSYSYYAQTPYHPNYNPSDRLGRFFPPSQYPPSFNPLHQSPHHPSGNQDPYGYPNYYPTPPPQQYPSYDPTSGGDCPCPFQTYQKNAHVGPLIGSLAGKGPGSQNLVKAGEPGQSPGQSLGPIKIPKDFSVSSIVRAPSKPAAGDIPPSVSSLSIVPLNPNCTLSIIPAATKASAPKPDNIPQEVALKAPSLINNSQVTITKVSNQAKVQFSSVTSSVPIQTKDLPSKKATILPKNGVNSAVLITCQKSVGVDSDVTKVNVKVNRSASRTRESVTRCPRLGEAIPDEAGVLKKLIKERYNGLSVLMKSADCKAKRTRRVDDDDVHGESLPVLTYRRPKLLDQDRLEKLDSVEFEGANNKVNRVVAVPLKQRKLHVRRRHLVIEKKPHSPIPLPVPKYELAPKWSNGWSWEGEPKTAFVYIKNDDPPISRICYASMRHSEGDVIYPGDCILLKSGVKNTDLPFVARVAALWENPNDGEMMVSVLWYYRPEHTDLGRGCSPWEDEIFASRHRDVNSVACIEDKCFVLTFNEYCRYRKRMKMLEEGGINQVSIVPNLKDSYPRDRQIPKHRVALDRLFFCHRVYDFRQKRILKNPT